MPNRAHTQQIAYRSASDAGRRRTGGSPGEPARTRQEPPGAAKAARVPDAGRRRTGGRASEPKNLSKRRFLTMKSTTFGAAGVLANFSLPEPLPKHPSNDPPRDPKMGPRRLRAQKCLRD